MSKSNARPKSLDRFARRTKMIQRRPATMQNPEIAPNRRTRKPRSMKVWGSAFRRKRSAMADFGSATKWKASTAVPPRSPRRNRAPTVTSLYVVSRLYPTHRPSAYCFAQMNSDSAVNSPVAGMVPDLRRTKRRRTQEDLYEPSALKRRAVSPGVCGSPILAQSPPNNGRRINFQGMNGI